MSQRHVENFIGRLVTDIQFRRAFAANAQDVLAAFRSENQDLAPVEMSALARIDPDAVNRLARTIDPRLKRLSIEPSGTFQAVTVRGAARADGSKAR
jgi:hypothetical protein